MTVDQRTSGQDPQTAQLAARITVDQPSLLGALRRSSERVCQYAGLLEAALIDFRPLEGYLVGAIKHVEVIGDNVRDDLYNRLADRLGVSEVRIALQRVADAHPDALEEPSAGGMA